MSVYLVDKILYTIDADQALFARYEKDPAAVVAEVERDQAERVTLAERSRGVHTLTAEERAALVAQDWARLYAMGAHPFILWIFFYALSGHRPDLRGEYRTRVAAIGRPDFST